MRGGQASRSFSSRVRYVLSQGVVRWGFITGILWSIAISVRTGKPLASVLPFALIAFPIGGIIYGLITWPFSAMREREVLSRDETAAATADDVPPSAVPLRVDSTSAVRNIGVSWSRLPVRSRSRPTTSA